MTSLSLRKITSLGVTHSMAIDEARGIKLCNQLSLLGGAASFMLAMLHGTLVAWNAVPLVSFFVGLSFLIPVVCNASGFTVFSRVYLSLYLPTCITLISIGSKIYSTQGELDFEGTYYSYHFFLIVTAIGTLGLFEHTKKGWGYLSSAYVAMMITSFNVLHNLFGVGYYQTGHADPNYYFATVVVLLGYGILLTGVSIMKHNIDKNEEALLLEIEDRKKAESEIREAQQQAVQANKTKSEFLANVSHEIRTPLNGVIGFSDLVLKTQLDATQNKYMTVLNTSALSLLDIVNDILDFSKIEAGKLQLEIEKCNLPEVGQQVIEAFTAQAEQKGLKLTLTRSPDCPTYVLADPIRLRQVLVNLMGNAIKFTHQGEIALTIQLLHQADRGQSSIRFSVRDTGIGINQEDQEKIFEAFAQGDSSSTKKYGGTGLGLTISNSLLALMDSKLELASEVGKGSTFSFTLLMNTSSK
jgi:signal transduction histidine kinase